MAPPPLPPEVPVRLVRPHRAHVILILAGLGLAFAPFAFAALFLSRRDLRDMAAGGMDRAGEALTKTGRLIAIIGTIINILEWLVYLVIGLLVYFNWTHIRSWF